MRTSLILIFSIACTHTPGGKDAAGDSPAPADSTVTADTAMDSTVDSVPTVSSPTCTLVTLAGSPSFNALNLYAVEGDAVSWQVACSDHPDAVLSLASPPGNATWSANTLAWTPPLDAAGRYDLDLVADIDGSGVPVTATLWVSDNWRDPGNSLVDPVKYSEEDGVPVLNMDLPPQTNYDVDTPGNLYWQGHQYAVGVQYRGASSSYYPKHSYSVHFDATDEFDAPGWHHRRNISITSTFDDNTYIRQKMCYDLWSSLSTTHPVFQTKMVVLYLNDVYEGLMLISDHVDGQWEHDNGYSNTGALYKAIDHSANLDVKWNGSRKSSLDEGYEKKSGSATDWTDLEDLEKFVGTSDDATFEANLDTTMSRDDFMDWWVFVRFVDAGDSAGKNSYLYRDPLDPVGIWHYTPWDFNHSMGQDWETVRVDATDSDDFTENNKFFERAFALPDLAPEMTSRMRTALDGPFAKAAVLQHYDDEYAIIDAAARRDWDKWADQYDSYWGWRGDLNDYDGEVAYLKQWASDRWDYMDSVTGR